MASPKIPALASSRAATHGCPANGVSGCGNNADPDTRGRGTTAADNAGEPPIIKDWNDLRFFLSVARLGSLSAASRALKVDPATVARRVNSLEGALSLKCFEHRADGYRLTDGGRKLLEHAERVESDFLGLSRAVEGEDLRVSGPVTITASDSVTLPFIIPALPGLREQHPGIKLDLISSNRVLSLARREADIAVRMVRPEEGDLLARRIATMGYGLYASAGYLERAGIPETLEDLRSHSLIDWLEEYPKAATSAWFRQLAETAQVPLRLNGAYERLSAARAGVGVACLGYIMARDQGLCQVLPDVHVPPLELWLTVHPDSARVRRVRAVMDYLVKAANLASRRFTGPG